jgi:hypothetical protein
LADQGVEHEVAYREAGRQSALLTRSEALGPVASTARCAVDADNCVDLPSRVVPDGPLLTRGTRINPNRNGEAGAEEREGERRPAAARLG